MEFSGGKVEENAVGVFEVATKKMNASLLLPLLDTL